MNRITRAAAAAQNLRFYFTGKPCCRGHISLRYVAGQSCLQCLEERMATAPERARRAAYQKARRRQAAIALAALAELGVKMI
ncbi:MAG: hypothetical protein ACLP0B_19495 [Steroidobacteraceae bacterium]